MNFKKNAENANKEKNGFPKFLILLFIGFLIIFAGIIVLIIAAVLSGGSTSFGALVFIGPFPIVVGAGPEATWMVSLVIILAVLSIIMFLIIQREAKKMYA